MLREVITTIILIAKEEFLNIYSICLDYISYITGFAISISSILIIRYKG